MMKYQSSEPLPDASNGWKAQGIREVLKEIENAERVARKIADNG